MNYYAYIAIAGEDKLRAYTFSPDTGRLRFLRDTPIGGAPSPLAVDPKGRCLYAGLRSTCEIASFRIAQDTGELTLLGKVALESDPCYISTDQRGRFLLAAYYRAGRVSVHPIGEDGVVGGPPVEWRVTAPKAHCIMTDRSNRFVFVPHVVESNVILQFVFDEETGTLTPNAVPKVVPAAGEGPRHYCYHPTKDFVYTSNEQGCSATAYRFDPSAGTLTAFQTISTLPEGYEGKNTCAQIHITPSGRYLYISNRGHDSIAMFAVDQNTGRLTSLGQQPTEKTPRVFNIDPTGRFLFAAGQATGNLASYRINAHTGQLQPLEIYSVGENPMWVLFLELS